MTSHREQRPTGWRALVERERERESGDPRGLWARAAGYVAAAARAWPGDAASSRSTGAQPGEASDAAPKTARPDRATE